MKSIVLLSLFLVVAYSSECDTTAGKWKFVENCLDCHPTCKTCNGPSMNDCLSCDTTKYIFDKHSSEEPKTRILDDDDKKDQEDDKPVFPANSGKCKCKTDGQQALKDGSCIAPSEANCKTKAHFYDATKKECMPCYFTCSACKKYSSDACTNCDDTIMVAHNTPDSGDEQMCICKNSKLSRDNKNTLECVADKDSCGAGYWADWQSNSSQCVKCAPMAASCTSDEQFTCLTGLVKIRVNLEDKCGCTLDTHYEKVKDSVRTCAKCTEITNCDKCQNNGCKTCKAGFKLTKTYPVGCEEDKVGSASLLNALIVMFLTLILF